MSQQFNVVEYFADGTCKQLCHQASALVAIQVAAARSESESARRGRTRRIVITDSDEAITLEWKYGQGLLFPLSHGFLPEGVTCVRY